MVSISSSSKNIPVPRAWIQSIACWLESYEMMDELAVWLEARGAEIHGVCQTFCCSASLLGGAAGAPPSGQAGTLHPSALHV